MKILAHRGFWKYPSEKNTLVAFQRAFDSGFGVETDIRDLNGNLVISHDLPFLDNKNMIGIDDFFRLYKRCGTDLPLALNIKADGLQEELLRIINMYDVNNYFVFDMSIPDTIGYLNNGFNVFTRQSEYELSPVFGEKVQGFWLDEFQNHWITSNIILKHLENKKRVCIVSPELHKREYELEWRNYKAIDIAFDNDEILLCTDFPDLAKIYFG